VQVPDASWSGAYTLQVVAWDAEGMSARNVASTGARALRLLPLSSRYRLASFATRLEL
jgi:hypothetical protein